MHAWGMYIVLYYFLLLSNGCELHVGAVYNSVNSDTCKGQPYKVVYLTLEGAQEAI